MTAVEILAEFIQRRTPSVLVIGDVMLDEFVNGSVRRISPEGPFPVLELSDRKALLGGAGNVAHNLRTLGACVDVVSVTGEDRAGEQIRTLLLEDGVGIQGLWIDQGRVTTIKTRYGSQGHQILRVDEETKQPLPDSWVDWVEKCIRSGDYDAVIISDYGKGAVTTPGVPRAVMEISSELRVPTFVDTKTRDVSIFAGATVMKPNRTELETVAVDKGQLLTRTEQLAKYKAISGAQNVVATLGEEGIAVMNGKELRVLPSTARRVFDVTGAGDTVMATLVLAFLAGLSWEKCAELANSAASIVVSRYGTSSVTVEEMRQLESP